MNINDRLSGWFDLWFSFAIEVICTRPSAPNARRATGRTEILNDM